MDIDKNVVVYEDFITAFNNMAGICHETAEAKGWGSIDKDTTPIIGRTLEYARHNLNGSREAIVMYALEVAKEINWKPNGKTLAEDIALMHSELSEALEGLRAGNPPDDKIPEYSSVAAEFADVIIRIMDAAKRHGVPVAEALVAKAAYNTGRPYLHGGKKF